MKLGIKEQKLESISEKLHSADDCFTEAITTWLQSEVTSTQDDLDKALQAATSFGMCHNEISKLNNGKTLTRSIMVSSVYSGCKQCHR